MEINNPDILPLGDAGNCLPTCFICLLAANEPPDLLSDDSVWNSASKHLHITSYKTTGYFTRLIDLSIKRASELLEIPKCNFINSHKLCKKYKNIDCQPEFWLESKETTNIYKIPLKIIYIHII